MAAIVGFSGASGGQDLADFDSCVSPVFPGAAGWSHNAIAMVPFLTRVFVVLALAFAPTVFAQSGEPPCKNHYILVVPGDSLEDPCAPCPEPVPLNGPRVLLQQKDKALVVGTEMRFVTRGANRRALDSLAVMRVDALGAADLTWGDCGIARIPIWGADDEARNMVFQPDRKILVLATALDPTEYLINDYLLEPHSYLAVIRLNEDGTLDRAFGNGGRVVFRVGQQEYSTEFDVNSRSAGLDVDGDGLIRVSLQYPGDPYVVPVAQIRPDGTIKAVDATAPWQIRLRMQLEAFIEFANDGGKTYVTSDPDEAVLLDRGDTWYRTGRAFGTPKAVPAP
jgi:hypothetical protein